MVSETCPPTKKAPANSATAAIKMACLKVKLLEPTLVPIALATSLAPILQAIYIHAMTANEKRKVSKSKSGSLA
jgi:hypothetical protein